MSKDKPNKTNKVNYEVLKDKPNVYYCAIVASDADVRAIYNDKDSSFLRGSDNEFCQKALMHASLWRSAGNNLFGTSSYTAYLNTKLGKECTDEDIAVDIEAMHVGITKDIMDYIATLRGKALKEFMDVNGIIVNDYVEVQPDSLIKNEVFNNIVSNFFSFGVNPNVDKKDKKIFTYNAVCRCVYNCLQDTLLGVGNAPIYVPIIKRKIGRSVTFVAIFNENPLYPIFERWMNFVITSRDEPEVKQKKSVLVKIEDFTKDLFNKLKKPPEQDTGKS